MQVGRTESATDTTTVDPGYSTDKEGFAAKVGEDHGWKMTKRSL